ncbi:hypothetical protein [Glutamicibacter ardleyensis]|uniref:Uncharacterized protein n=1 Tax=Glutamicibacter ardleyensis TaxID=225894 RepID=A0ABQ2DI63_9MICC|nr:hypothetical protein [Glutamicibacter ardleyensis]GGJ55661.1 hypothetical protein GCM10007173_13050 [Glutamicibacter ardleyensis]
MSISFPIVGTTAPTVPGRYDGDKYHHIANDHIEGIYDWDGTHWVPRQIEHLSLDSIDVGRSNVGFIPVESGHSLMQHKNRN